MKAKWVIIIGALVTIIGLLGWVFYASSKITKEANRLDLGQNVLGQKVADLSRDHVSVGTDVEYNSNPPTSGPHYADWIRAGVYDSPKDDRYLVHSLEHGYVIMWYNCDKKAVSYNRQDLGLEVVGEVLAHGSEEEHATESAQVATGSATLSENFKSEDCQKLIGELKTVYEEKGKSKLIVIPRANMDSRIALTAWTRLDKFDNFDKTRIVEFIDAYRNYGPEKTMEP